VILALIAFVSGAAIVTVPTKPPVRLTLTEKIPLWPRDTVISAGLKTREKSGVTGCVMVNTAAGELPPPGVGLVTVTSVVPAVVRSAPVIATSSWLLLRSRD